jgi:transcriptional regulator with XRE-family HTH domain
MKSPTAVARSRLAAPDAALFPAAPGPSWKLAPASPQQRLAQHEPERWDAWIRVVGYQVRRLRRFLGLTQQEVAQHAGVSQAAVSRLESGRGRMTPLLVVVKVAVVLRRSAAVLDRDVPSEALRAAFDGIDRIVPFPDDVDGLMPITVDEKLIDLVRLYRAAPDGERLMVLAVLRAVAHGGAQCPAQLAVKP